MQNKATIFLRVALAALGLGILVWLVVELKDGAIHWGVADYISSETTEQYSAASVPARIIGTTLFWLLSLGLIIFGISPRVLLKPYICIPWLIMMIGCGLLLKPYSIKIGP